MSDFNSKHNRVVWCDIPVSDLDRAAAFYGAALAIAVHKEQFGDVSFGVLDHHDGNGGCLVIDPKHAGGPGGMLLYFNADGRIRDAVAKAIAHGGKLLQDVHGLGPHGFRALLHDSEGNRIALHSNTDA